MNQELLRRYTEDKCTPEEIRGVESWLADPANEAVVETKMRAYWDALPQYSPTPDLSPLLANIIDQIENGQAEKGKVEPVALGHKHRLLFLKIAAVFLVLMVSLAALYLSQERSFTPEQTQAWVQQHEEISASGLASEIILEDGTHVWLNAQSTLKYAKTFEANKREVYLEGEAYFDVAEDKTRPFIVYTNDIHITVLGTAFTVKAYKDDATSETVLVRGKVLVEKQNLLTRETRQLKPNERAVFDRASKEISVSNVTATNFTTWREGTLRFESEPISNVLRTLQRWYDVKIIFQDQPQSTCVLTARIQNETLEETLELLRFSTGVEYEMAGDTVYLKGAVCNN